MNRFVWIAIGSIIFVLLIFSGSLKSSNTETSNATSVWSEYRSIEHNFIAEFPSTPQIEKSSYDITPGVAVEKTNYGSQLETTDGSVTLLGIVVEKLPFEMKISDPKKVVDLGIKGELDNAGSVLSSETGNFMGKLSDTYKIKNGKGIYVSVRRIFVGNLRYSLRVASSSSSDITFNKLVNSFRFINSDMTTK